MASVYRQTYKRPLPAGSEVVTRRGQRLARWKDRRGRVQMAPLSEDGSHIILTYRCGYISFQNKDGQREVVQGFTDRQATEAKARELERHAGRARVGLEVVDREKALLPWREAADAYLAELERLGRDSTYRYNINAMLSKMAAACDWSTLASIRAEPVGRFLGELRRDVELPGGKIRKARSCRTQNEYLATVNTFLAWCVKPQHWLEGNPLAGLPYVEDLEPVRQRRALAPEQLQLLLDVSEDRKPVYLTAALTGLRRKELRRLQWGDVHLDAEVPAIYLRATATKAKRADTLPLSPELVEFLTALRPADATATTPVFASVPTLRTYKVDLARAKIPYRDAAGRQADFHSLRMAYGMMLQRACVAPRVAMQLMRHSDIRLTMRIYVDPTLLDTAGAVAKLPRLTGEKAAPAREMRA
jgi:integrase